MQAPDLAHARLRRMTREEYHRAGEAGLYEQERVELIRGMVVVMSPVGPDHADPIDVLNEQLVPRLTGRAKVRIQQPFVAADDSEPEPDVALVPSGRYRDRHPDRAFLVIEVAKSSLAFDRDTKAPLYAESNVDEYWIVDVESRTVEVYRDPAGGRYTSIKRFELGETVPILAFPEIQIPVASLFE